MRWGPFIFGGLLLGPWLYGVLFGFPEVEFSYVPWLGGGMMGLVLAAAMYLARVGNETTRTLVIAVVGISLGLLVTAMFVRESFHIIATFLTWSGGGLLVAGAPLPAPRRPEPANDEASAA